MTPARFIHSALPLHRSNMEKRMSADLDSRPRRTDPAYSEVELEQSTDISDYDWSTLAVLGGIIVFTLLMLSVLVIAF
jgi:hypothetical protein